MSLKSSSDCFVKALNTQYTIQSGRHDISKTVTAVTIFLKVADSTLHPIGNDKRPSN